MNQHPSLSQLPSEYPTLRSRGGEEREAESEEVEVDKVYRHLGKEDRGSYDPQDSHKCIQTTFDLYYVLNLRGSA